MKNTSIKFNKERDFGDLFNATFGFINQEFKRLAIAIFYFVVPFLLLSAVASIVYSVKAQELSHSIDSAGKPDPFAIFSTLGSLMGYVFFMIGTSIIASTMLLCTVLGYIKLYIQRGAEGFSNNDLWMQITENFWRFLGTSIVIGILVCIGLVLCVIPGIYLGIALSIVLCIMIFEEKSFSDSFSRSMKLINTNWWLAFGVFVIAFILYYILSVFISLPSILMGFKSIFTNIKNGQNAAMNLSIDFYVVSAITKLLTQVISVIPIVISAFLYYSFVEKVEKPSLMDKIDQIQDNE